VICIRVWKGEWGGREGGRQVWRSMARQLSATIPGFGPSGVLAVLARPKLFLTILPNLRPLQPRTLLSLLKSSMFSLNS
jgi:hypothetical protein